MKLIIALLVASAMFLSFRAHATGPTIHYCKDLTADQFHKAARMALNERRYKIESESANSVIGRSGGKKAEFEMRGARIIVVGWVAGFGGEDQRHLTALKNEMLWALAGERRPGEVTINWCDDLTTDWFHRVAVGVLHRRHYKIEVDSPNGVIARIKELKVDITIEKTGRIVIKWVPGYAYHKDNYLNNLFEDITWTLAL
jgi:hypothetical protein